MNATCAIESGALDRTTGGAASTTCPTVMTQSQSCQAICPNNAAVEGTIKCMSGRLVDASHCLSSAGLLTERVTKVVGTVDVELTGVPTVVLLTAAVATAF